jgi:hypothetical protein
VCVCVCVCIKPVYVKYKTPKPQDMNLCVSDVWNLQLFVFDRRRLLGRPRRLTAHEVALQLARSFPSNTFDFLCEYHRALTRACLLISYQRCVFLTIDCVFGLVLSNSAQGSCKQQKDSWTQRTVLLFHVILFCFVRAVVAFQPSLLLLCVFFCVIPLRLNFICRRFGTLFHLHRQVGV